MIEVMDTETITETFEDFSITYPAALVAQRERINTEYLDAYFASLESDLLDRARTAANESRVEAPAADTACVVCSGLGCEHCPAA